MFVVIRLWTVEMDLYCFPVGIAVISIHMLCRSRIHES